MVFYNIFFSFAANAIFLSYVFKKFKARNSFLKINVWSSQFDFVRRTTTIRIPYPYSWPNICPTLGLCLGFLSGTTFWWRRDSYHAVSGVNRRQSGKIRKCFSFIGNAVMPVTGIKTWRQTIARVRERAQRGAALMASPAVQDCRVDSSSWQAWGHCHNIKWEKCCQ